MRKTERFTFIPKNEQIDLFIPKSNPNETQYMSLAKMIGLVFIAAFRKESELSAWWDFWRFRGSEGKRFRTEALFGTLI